MEGGGQRERAGNKKLRAFACTGSLPYFSFTPRALGKESTATQAICNKVFGSLWLLFLLASPDMSCFEAIDDSPP